MSRRPKKPDGLTYDEIKRQIKERRIDPLYLFVGEEQYLQERAIRLLFNTLDESGRMFNLAVLSMGGDAGSKVTAAHVVDTANQLPMMSERRIIVVRDFEKLKEEECELLLEYLKRPFPDFNRHLPGGLARPEAQGYHRPVQGLYRRCVRPAH